MDSRKPFQLLVVAMLVLLGALAWVVNDAFTERVVEKGQSAPEFKIVTEQGRTITPTSFGGKLLVLNFWATWCPPCVTETPSLNAMAAQLKAQGVVVVGVSVDKNDAAYKAFLQRNHIGFDTMRDGESRISASFGTYKFPETYLITPDGKVVDKIISNLDWTSDDVIKQLRSHL